MRGMLPWKKARGKEAYKRIMCYAGVPKELEGVKKEVIEEAKATKLPILKYVTIGELCDWLRGKQR